MSSEQKHVTRSKVTVFSQTLCIGFSEICLCLTHNFVMHCGIYKLLGTNDHHDRKMWHRNDMASSKVTVNTKVYA